MESPETENLPIKAILGLSKYNRLQLDLAHRILGDKAEDRQNLLTWIDDCWDDARTVLERHREEILSAYMGDELGDQDLMERLAEEIKISQNETKGKFRDINMFQ